MAEIILFHSVLGLRHGVTDGANRLRDAGHIVYTPDYYDGEVFDDPAEGVRKREELGMEEITKRVRDSVAMRQPSLVYGGFGLGARCAQVLALTRKETQGLVLLHGALPAEETAPGGWPRGLPVQVHHADDDEWVDSETVDRLGRAVQEAGAGFEAHRYTGAARSLTDPDLPGYDHDTAEVMWDRVQDFVARVDRRAV